MGVKGFCWFSVRSYSVELSGSLKISERNRESYASEASSKN